MTYSTPSSRYNSIDYTGGGPLSMAGLPTVPTQNYGSTTPVVQQPVYAVPATPAPTTPTTPTTPGTGTGTLPSAPPPPGATYKPPGGYAKPFENMNAKMTFYGSGVGPNPVSAMNSGMALLQKKGGTKTPEELAANEAYVKDWLMTNYGVSWPAFAAGGPVQPGGPATTSNWNPLQSASSGEDIERTQPVRPEPTGPRGPHFTRPERDPRVPGPQHMMSAPTPSWGGRPIPTGYTPGQWQSGQSSGSMFGAPGGMRPPQQQQPMPPAPPPVWNGGGSYTRPPNLPASPGYGYQPNAHGPAWNKGGSPQIGGPLPPTSI